MNTAPDFFDELREWSERKHTILAKYVNMAARMLGGGRSCVYYIDGFAGRGWYGASSGGRTDGSPLLAAKLAQQFRHEDRNYSLRCINIEQNPENYQQLQEATAPYGDLVTNFQGEFSDTVSRILPIVGSDPVICFLDPFGVIGIDLSAIRKLLARPGAITDLWTRFDTGTIRRLDGLHNGDSPGAAKAFNNLTHIYGITDKDRLHQLLQGNDAEQRKNRAAKLYMQVLRDEYVKTRGKGYTCRYPIRTVTGEDKYHLIFAAGDRLPLLRTSEILYDAEERYKADKLWYLQQNTGQLGLWGTSDPSEQEIFEEKVSRLKDAITQHFKGESTSRGDINAFLILKGHWFGRFKGRHLTAALKGLIDSGIIITATGAVSSDTTLFKFI